MLQDTRRLYSRKIVATDGEIGSVRDFYFDDRRWTIRHIVVDAGPWLKGRVILLPPYAVVPDSADGGHTLQVNEPRAQIAKYPLLQSRLPVSREFDLDDYRHHGCSTRSVAGYHVSTREGPMGRISGFRVDVGNWTITQMRVEPGKWYSGKEIGIATDAIESIDHGQCTLIVGLSVAATSASQQRRKLRSLAV